jgi:hypothetical protein
MPSVISDQLDPRLQAISVPKMGEKSAFTISPQTKPWHASQLPAWTFTTASTTSLPTLQPSSMCLWISHIKTFWDIVSDFTLPYPCDVTRMDLKTALVGIVEAFEVSSLADSLPFLYVIVSAAISMRAGVPPLLYRCCSIFDSRSALTGQDVSHLVYC